MNNITSSILFQDYAIYSSSLTEMPVQSKTLINTINQYSYCIAEQDATFKDALQKSDILLPDGIAIVAAVKWIVGKKIKKIAGADLHQFLLEDLNKKGGSCFYLGTSPGTLLKIEERLKKDFPNVKVKTFSPAFKLAFTIEENTEMINEVNTFQPDVLFVGMTAPKQEKWSYEHKEAIDAKVICSIGAVFDFYAGTVVRPHPFWIGLGLEWFVRLLKEPKRMWKRYMYYGPVFIKLIIAEKFKK